MEDPTHIKIAELLNRMSNVTMSSYPDLHGLVILKAGNHAAKYGNTEKTCVGYLGYSISARSIFGDYTASERFGDVSIRLVEKYDRNSSKCVAYFVIGSLISHWTKHAKYGLEYLEKAVSCGIDSGDILTVGYSYNVLLENRFFLGHNLGDLAYEVEKKLEVAKRFKHENLLINATTYSSAISALQGKKTESLEHGAALLERDELIQLARGDKTSYASYLFYRMLLGYMTGNYRTALSTAEEITPLLAAITGFMISAQYNFYYSLAITAAYPELSPRERRHYDTVLRKNQRQMRKWAKVSKENFEHKYLLVAAETARLQNKKDEAMSLYEDAIRLAKENGYINDEALANELAARFYLSAGFRRIAGVYMAEAYRGYNSWQAFAKAKDLLNRYGEFLEGIDAEEASGVAERTYENLLTATRTEAEAAVSTDTYFLEEAIERITTETDIDKLFNGFLDIAVKGIGADKGCLILEKSGELYIEAAIDAGYEAVPIKSVGLEEYDAISKAVVRYVARTLETVVLDCRKNPGVFASDPYIAETNPGTITCMPLLMQGIPFGVLYLENSFISGVFSSDRLEALKLLSAQVAFAKRLQSFLGDDSPAGAESDSINIIEALTEREAEVLELIAEGLSNREIAERLIMTVNTVKTHIKNIYGKLQVSRRVQAVKRAKQLKLLKNFYSEMED